MLGSVAVVKAARRRGKIAHRLESEVPKPVELDVSGELWLAERIKGARKTSGSD